MVSDSSPNKISPATRRRVRELARTEPSRRKLAALLQAEGIQVSPSTVRNILLADKEREERRGQGGAGDGSGDAAGGAQGAGRGEGVVEVPGFDDPALTVTITLPEDASVAARMVHQEWLEVQAMARVLRPKVVAEEIAATQWTQLKTTALRMSKALAELLPPPKLDPSKDPTNIGAREAVHAHVLRIIEACEARSGRFYVGASTTPKKAADG